MKHFLAAAALVALLLFLITRNVSSDPYIYDEADYMYAASLGYFANWTDTPTLPLPDFLRIGLSRGRQTGGRQELSEFIRQSNDIVFYRHWHGPLYHYFLIPVSRLGLNEHDVRAALVGIPVMTLLAIYFGCLWLIPGSLGLLTAFLTSVLFLSSFTVFRSTELAPHQLFALCYLCCLIFLAKTVATGRRSDWHAAVIMAALAFCTLEVALVALLTVAICGYIGRERLQMDWRLAARSFGLFVATVLIVWPAAIFKLTFVKSYIFMAYLALARKGSWGNTGFFGTWGNRILSSPLEWAVVAVALILYLRRPSQKDHRLVYPALIFAVLMLAATARVLSDSARYSLPFMPALDLFAAITLAPAIFSLRRPAAFGLAGVLVAAAVLEAFNRPSRSDPHPSVVLQHIRQANLTDKALLVPQSDLPMIHYYFPATRLRGYYTPQPVAADLEGFAPDAILYP
ncbi:MAG TPA: hypothetical protein VNX70_04130 [Bryobacteraceae bacterium]|nr:hypothetical protein [Bryobacteraceae bacterium]